MSYRLWPAQVTAAAVVVTLGFASRPPDAGDAQRAELAQRFAFARIAVPRTATPADTTVHPVNPVTSHIARWLSSVGTSIAMGDLDEDGVANDMCIVEPRTGEVLAAPAPGTGERFTPFVVQSNPAWDPHALVATGCKIGDYNEDGLSDLLVHFVGRTPLLFLREAPSRVAELPPQLSAELSANLLDPVAPPTATDAVAPTLETALSAFTVQPLVATDEPWWTSTVLQVDLDADGHLDLVVGNYFPDGQEIFGADATGPVTMHDSFTAARNGGKNRVYLWKAGAAGEVPSVRYEEAPNPFPDDDATAWTLALGAADLDQDGRSELYVANDFGPDTLYLNQSTPGALKLVKQHGRTGFAIPSSLVLGNDAFKGMGVDFGDVNGDQRFDIFVSNITAHGGLEESHFLFVSDKERMGEMADGVAPYDDVGEAVGVSRSSWAWDTRLADFDNDGSLELMQATGFLKGRLNWWADLAELANSHDAAVSNPQHWPNFPEDIDISGHDPEPFYTRGADGRYVDLSRQVGFDGQYNARGLALADIDSDGDLDIALANQWEDSWVFRNDAVGGRSLGLRLVLAADATETTVGPRDAATSMPAIGAFATVTAPDGRTWIRQVDGGNGHSGASAPELLFGLGDVPADAPLAVHLRWRDHQGQLRETNLTLSPGWHTVTLATSS